MTPFTIASNYNKESPYHNSFNKLAMTIFDLDFSPLFDQDRTMNRFSFVDGDRVISSISTYETEWVIGEKIYKALQIATVMTDLSYRKQGLSSRLLEHVLEQYNNQVDFFYLFANLTATSFYPKFGFERKIESTFQTKKKIVVDKKKTCKLKLLTIENENHKQLIYRIINNAIPQQTTMAIAIHPTIASFHLFIEMPDIIYYSEQWDALLLFEMEGALVHLYDVISTKRIDLMKLLQETSLFHGKRIAFYFTPEIELELLQVGKDRHSEDALFVLRAPELPQDFYIPMTGRA